MRPGRRSSDRRASSTRVSRSERTAAISGRRGRPVSSARTEPGSRAREPSNVRAIAVAILASSRFARPGTAFCSCTTVGTRNDRAASTGAMLAYPPMPRTADAPRTTGRAAITDPRATNGAVAERIEISRRNGAARRPWNRKPAAGTSDASWPSGAPMNSTDAPPARRRCATAIDGEMCPAVPPPAITTLTDYPVRPWSGTAQASSRSSARRRAQRSPSRPLPRASPPARSLRRRGTGAARP